jgi:hypothetical protein
MLPGTQTLQQMNLGRDKASYSVQFGLAPYFHDRLMDCVNKAPVYVVCFDESLNKVTQEKQMDCHVRYYDCATRFITSSFLGHAKASDLNEAFQDNCKRLDPQKLLQVSMDGPNVNLKFHMDLSSQLVADYNKKPVDLGTCGLHQVHNAFKHSMQVKQL